MTELGTRFPLGEAAGALRIMVVDDEAAIRGPLGLCVETLGHRVFEAASVEEALTVANRETLDMALVDLRLGTGSGLDLMTRLLAMQPRLKIIIITAYGSVDVAVRAMARGAIDFLCKPFTPDQVATALARAASLRDLESHVGILTDSRGTAGPEADFASTSAALQDAVMTVRRLAPSDTPVLIAGEPGTGKRVLARAIHGWGNRPEGPFVGVDCLAHSPAYVDLALFGETLAAEQVITSDRPSLTARAGGGTLLVRRVEALSPRSQARLARLIETRTDEPLGASKPVTCDFRVVLTTAAKSAAEFAPPLQPLFDRIRVLLPPLRERMDDIPTLAQRYLSFARQGSEKQLLGFSIEALDRLQAYSWPDNLRELHTVVDEAFKWADSSYIEARHLRLAAQAVTTPRRRPRAGDPISLKDLETAHIREVLASNKSLQEAADVLGLDLQALYRRRKQYGLE